MNSRLQYLEALPKKRMAVGVLLFDPRDRLLIVKPQDRPGWSIPGGVVERNESPLEAAYREVQEELGIRIRILRCAGVDYSRTQIDGQWAEGVHFLFWGEVLSPEQIQQIRLQREELQAYRFAEPSEALTRLEPKLAQRIRQILSHPNCCFYMENGIPIR